MKTIAVFNNKGGVGKTSLVYHLAYMLPRLGYPTVAVDLDPQANLTASFFDEDRMELLWEEERETVLSCVNPILEGTGDIAEPVPHEVAENLWLISGDLGLSRFEDKLSDAWPRGYNNDPAALRTTSAFHRITQRAGTRTGASVALIDVGPHLGAMNRSALLAADFLVVPLAADLYSLQGLKNLGPTVRTWRQQWTRVREQVTPTNFDLPRGAMRPAGYVILQHAVRLDRPARAYGRWLARIPAVYREAVLDEPSPSGSLNSEDDEHCLAMLRNFRSLMPLAQDARKPMFDLRPADGAIGSHAQLALACADDFRHLAERIAEKCELRSESAE
jgi:chromosome partitioning protein